MKNSIKSKVKKNIENIEEKYYNFEDIKKLVSNSRIKTTNSTLKTYINYFVKDKILFDAGKGWYSSLETKFELDEKPLENILKIVSKEYPLLDFSCWSTEQLNSYTHHILAKFITFIYVDSDYIDSITSFLKEKKFVVLDNPTQQELGKYFKLEEDTIIIRPSITKQPDNGKIAPIEKILVDMLIENKKVKIMEDFECKKIIEDIINNNRINVSLLKSYATRRKLFIDDFINQVQIKMKVEVVDK